MAKNGGEGGEAAKGDNEMTELTLKGEKYRIRRLDPRNLVIEKYVPPTKAGRKQEDWTPLGYYGNLDDLAFGLIKYLVEIPEGENVLEQVVLLRREVKNLDKDIRQLVRLHQGVKERITEQA